MSDREREQPPTEEAADSQPDRPQKRGSFGNALRGLARAGGDEARRLADAARPEVERRARQARAAAEAAAPHVRRAAEDATSYVRDHQAEIRRGAKRGAGVVADQAVRTVTPRPLRPAIDAMKDELRERPDTASETPDTDTETPNRDTEAGEGTAERA